MAYNSPYYYGSSIPFGSYSASYNSSGSSYDYMPPYNDYSSRSTSSKRHKEEYASYFLPGYGVSRQVIFSWYQRLLGPSATIKPFSYQKREGYMITNAGSPLTKSQIEDLKSMSLEYEEKEAMRMMSKSASVKENEVYINQPVPIQQRSHYDAEGPYDSRRDR